MVLYATFWNTRHIGRRDISFCNTVRKRNTTYVKLQTRAFFTKTRCLFSILPLFALANTAIPFHSSVIELSSHPLALGIFAGLVLGKPIGIVSFSLLAEKLGIASISKNISTKQLIGAGILGGIGFTMAIFVTNLAFNDTSLIDIGKIAILIASTAAAALGYLLLKQS